MTHRIYVDIDTQVDFCSKSGSAFVPGASEAIDRAEALVNHATRNNHIIVGSVTTHMFDAYAFGRKDDARVRPFCVKGTQGWLKVHETSVKNAVFVPDVRVPDVRTYIRPRVQGIYFEKEVGSLVSNPNTVNLLQELAFDRQFDVEYVVFGVATDMSILPILMLLKQHAPVIVAVDAVVGVTSTVLEATGVSLVSVSSLVS